ncbi:MAG: aminotransferase class I/II-fold pyridoxal phosphate-dependent enzyme [Bacteroidota bacterium]
MANLVSHKAEHLIGSEIIKLAGEVNQKIKEGQTIYNLTIGDFDPNLFSIPTELKQYIIDAYTQNQTNYPPADGMLELRTSIAAFIKEHQGLTYSANEYLVAGGGRPLIYAIYQTLLDIEDKVIYPIPSWNNNHYCHLSDAQKIEIETTPENGFLPTAEELKPFIAEATIIALCSPLNPTGTMFRKEQLLPICEMVIAENELRKATNKKPLYVLYDQIYWMLTMKGIDHVDPVSLVPEMKEYTIFVDGISKALAATGVRVGWSFGPEYVIAKMKAILGHIGAWAPKAEQVAVSNFLQNKEALASFVNELKQKVTNRFDGIYNGFEVLHQKGYPVKIIAPEGAIYLTAQFALKGCIQANGKVINSTEDITAFLLDNASIAVVPFTAFGVAKGTDWYRISVGTLKESDVPEMLTKLEQALATLKLSRTN